LTKKSKTYIGGKTASSTNGAGEKLDIHIRIYSAYLEAEKVV
jgi:hypothetical protein